MKPERIGLLLLGAGVFSWGVFFACRALRRSRRWHVADGKVIRYEENEEGSIFPVVSYTDEEGRALVFRSSVSGTIADRVNVAFDPTDPAKAEVQSFQAFWLLPIILVGAGIGMMALSTTVK